MIELVDMEAVGDHDECCGHCGAGRVMRPGCGDEDTEDARLTALRRYLSAMSRPSTTAERLAARESVYPDDLAVIECWEGIVNREIADLTAERDEARAEVEAIRAKLDEARRRMAVFLPAAQPPELHLGIGNTDTNETTKRKEVTLMASEAAPSGQAKGCRGCAHNDGRTVTCWAPRDRAASDEIDAWATAHLADNLLTPNPGAPECPGREVAP
jgi:hypothetical protein